MRGFKGYMTLEATLIVPMVICIFALIIYCANYMYARCILSQDCYLLAFEATSNDLGTTFESLADLEQKGMSLATKKYFGNRQPSFSVTGSMEKEVRASGETETKHGTFAKYFLMPHEGWGLEASFTAKKRNYAGHIRKVKRVTDLGKEFVD
jgi:hypothetical protein